MTPEIEIQVIAHLLDEPKNYLTNSVRLHEELFTDVFLREIFVRYCTLFKANRTPEAGNVSTDDETRTKVLKIVSEINYDMSFDGWLELLVDKWVERKFNQIITKSTLSKTEIRETIAELQRELAGLTEINIKEPRHIKENIKDVFRVMDQNQTRQGITGINTGLAKVNDFTGGWQLSDLIVIAGDTSQGKTSLALQFARNAALSGTPTGIYSYEMSSVQLTARLMSQEVDVSSKKMLIEKIDVDEMRHIQSKVIKLSNAQIFIDECASTKLAYLINSMTSLNLIHGVKVFMIDYLQLLSNPIKGFSKEQEIGSIARELKNFAKRAGVVVFLLSQLNRSQNHRGSSEPKISDLRDSGQIEEAADIVILCYRPEVYGIAEFNDSDRTPTAGAAQLIFGKGRNIGLNRILLNFNKELTLFTNYNYAGFN